MSNVHPTASSSHNQASNFQHIINNALDVYKKRTKNDLLAHPLVTALQSCNSPSTILAVLQQQLQGLDQSRRSEGVGLVFSPAKVIFAGAAEDVRASQDTLIDIFERIEMFFRRLETYTQVPPTTEMMDMIIQIMVEVLYILGIVTKEIKQGRTKKFLKKLIGRTDMEDGLKRLDKLTQEMVVASAQRKTSRKTSPRPATSESLTQYAEG
ncbi:hypothetical protein BGY98DRAFT_1101705 [Russula aff. rugulosa BPL654]|nr:hypothetical protein BGY98DRAFT_1101705 [Russula aff. rugulosa BPL654]